jgi:hypothetical protein
MQRILWDTKYQGLNNCVALCDAGKPERIRGNGDENAPDRAA